MRSVFRIAAACAAIAVLPTQSQAGSVDWPSYNRTLLGERFAPLREIDAETVRRLHVICKFDSGEVTGFESGLVEVGGAIYFSSEHDTYSIGANDCRENWRVHEEFKSTNVFRASRGVAYFDGRIFRGTNDGRVLAYDARSGKRLWATEIGDPRKGESVPSAPIAWNGIVFSGIAGSETRGVKGRVYALDAESGKIIWEFYLVPREAGDKPRGPNPPELPAWFRQSWQLPEGFQITGGGTWTSFTLDPRTGSLFVPVGNPAPVFDRRDRGGDNLFTNSILVLDAKTGAYKKHFQLLARDFHDWDVNSPPILYAGKSGHTIMAEAPKDGFLYGYDLTSGKRLFRVAATTIENADVPLSQDGVHFCPGLDGGAEWNGPAFDPTRNLVFTGEVDWCARVTLTDPDTTRRTRVGDTWAGSIGFGQMDEPFGSYWRRLIGGSWAGWLTAFDGTTGAQKWRVQTVLPIVGGVTSTAGGLVLFGDLGGNFYVLDSSTGNLLWRQDLGAPIGGGVVAYDTGAGERVAVAAGLTSPIWRTNTNTAKIIVLGVR